MVQGSAIIRVMLNENSKERLSEKRLTVLSDKNTKSKPMIIEERGLHHEESEALVDVVNAGVGTNDLLELTSETNTLRR